MSLSRHCHSCNSEWVSIVNFIGIFKKVFSFLQNGFILALFAEENNSFLS